MRLLVVHDHLFDFYHRFLCDCDENLYFVIMCAARRAGKSNRVAILIAYESTYVIQSIKIYLVILYFLLFFCLFSFLLCDIADAPIY